MRTNVVPSPCTSEFSSSVARTCDSPPGLASPITDRLPSTVSCRPSRANAGVHSVTCWRTMPSTCRETAWAVRLCRASASSRSTTSASRSTWVIAAVASLDRLSIIRDEDLFQPHRQSGQRSTQLVRRIGGEPPLGCQHLRHSGDGVVEDATDLVELADPVPAMHRPRVTRAEEGCGVREVGQRLRQAPGLKPREHERDSEGEQGSTRRSPARVGG